MLFGLHCALCICATSKAMDGKPKACDLISPDRKE